MKQPSSWVVVLWTAILSVMLLAGGRAQAQGDLAATLEVLQAGVEVLRANTSNWLPVRAEGIVGVGDTIRTNETGRARVTFFADGTDTEILPNTEYRIEAFNGDDTQFTITAEVLVGQTLQRLSRLLDANSSYNILTPGLGLVARGTQFAIRVDDGGRSALLVQEGLVGADDGGRAPADNSAEVAPGFGVRATPDDALSDVVRAASFAELDAALDGCAVTLATADDVSLNVRSAPSTSAELVGYALASSISTAFGTVEGTDWYRIAFADSPSGYGWVLSSTARIGAGCAGLRVFAADHAEMTAVEAGSP